MPSYIFRKLIIFFYYFLNVIFTEITASTIISFLQKRNRFCLAHCDKLYCRSFASGSYTCFFYIQLIFAMF